MRMLDPATSVARVLVDPKATELAVMQRESLGKRPLTVLLPCYLPAGAKASETLAERALHAARTALLGPGAL